MKHAWAYMAVLLLVLGHGRVIEAQLAAPSSDDHGNGFHDATDLSLDSCLLGSIEPESDVDYFRIDVKESGFLKIYTNAPSSEAGGYLPFQAVGHLYDAKEKQLALGRPIGYNSCAGCPVECGTNFLIRRYISAGTYYVAASGQPTNCTQRPYPTAYYICAGLDDHGDEVSQATDLPIGGSLAGIRGRAGFDFYSDVDYFRINVKESGTLTVYTTGHLHTVGYLKDSKGNDLNKGWGDCNEHGDCNFWIEEPVAPGTYYVSVRFVISVRDADGYYIHAQLNEARNGSGAIGDSQPP